MRVFTIGHSTRPFDEVMAMLRDNSVDILVDVRSLPGSRRYPQWDREQLETSMPGDIDYTWLPALGGRRYTPVGAASENDGWRVKAFRDYADYMATDEFRLGLDELLALARDGTPAIMCSEAVPWRCHRRLITDALLVRGVEVSHIMGPTSVPPAETTEFLVVDGDRLTYPAT